MIRLCTNNEKLFKTLPPFIRGNPIVGGKISTDHSIDNDFETIDFFIVVLFEKIVNCYQTKFINTGDFDCQN